MSVENIATHLSALSPLCVTGLTSATEHPIDVHRIVALEWRPVELLMALGVMLLAVAEIENYRRWVTEPALPEHVIDVGLRNEPNLELLQRLNPSLFLILVARIAGLGIAMVLSAMLVSVLGVIGFIGLFSPLLARMLGARRLLPRLMLAMFLGALLLAVSDQSMMLLVLVTLGSGQDQNG